MQLTTNYKRSIRSVSWTVCLLIVCQPIFVVQLAYAQDPATAKVLDGTSILGTQGDIASALVDGVERFLLTELDQSVRKRISQWPKPSDSQTKAAEADAYSAATRMLREELQQRIGLIDTRVNCKSFTIQSSVPPIGSDTKWVAMNESCKIYSVRWPIFEGVDATGLLVVPNGEVRFHAVVFPDAGQSPKQLCGYDENSSLVALELAARGGIVVVPDTIRRNREARNGRAQLTDQEFLYRSAFVLGRHVIGYQVHEISAAFEALQSTYGDHPNLVAGWGEGGSLALYAAAVDTRIQAACVSGHFGPREGIWSEPIHRNVHGLLNHFGDAQLAALVAPRVLIIDAVPGPTVNILGEGGAPGVLDGPSLEQAQVEVQRTETMLTPWQLTSRIQIVKPTDANTKPMASTLNSLQTSLKSIGIQEPSRVSKVLRPLPWTDRIVTSEETRRAETLSKWNRFQQAILERSASERDQYWSKLDTKSLQSFSETIEPYREFFKNETIGDWGWEAVPLEPRTRLIYDEPKWLGYELVLDVHEDVIAYGTLLIPRDGKPVKNRPCVVFQHGLEGRPSDTIQGDHPAYHDVSRQLVEQGYVVFAPQNLYLFQDRFRTLQRKSNPLGKTLFSTIVAQHKQIVRWLGERDEIDPKRIAFYGLSYGGKSAMRIPALVPEYCLSICSADFNDWVWKNASTTSPYSYVWTNEYEIFEFGLGNHFNYAEMAALIAPRPFMVERGHFDGVAPDERVALEFAKVNRLYSAKLGLPDRCRIEWFAGPHTINGKGTFDFLSKHLKAGRN